MFNSLTVGYRWWLLLAAVLAALSAGATLFLFDYLNTQITAGKRTGDGWLGRYLAGAAALLVLSSAANTLMAAVSSRTVATLRRRLTRSILALSYAAIEDAGRPRLLSRMTEDVEGLSEGLTVAPQFLLNALLATISCAYLAYLSPLAFLWFGGTVLSGIVLTLLLIRIGQRNYEKYRLGIDKYFLALHGLLDGVRELIANAGRRQHFTRSELDPAIGELQTMQWRWDTYWHFSESWTRALILVALGVAMAGLQHYNRGSLELAISYFVTVTFLSGAVTFLVNAVAILGKARVCAASLATLRLDQENTDHIDVHIPADWREITMSGVTRTLRRDDGDTFQLGPISLTLHRGEVLFISGGNGSGKSTFAHILNGLSSRDTGDITVDGQSIPLQGCPGYRAIFSSVFPDSHLFRPVLDKDGRCVNDDHANGILDMLCLDGGLRVVDGHWAATSLSRGQHKRAALAQAILYDTPVLLLDEWAADQDPSHRAHFYEAVIPLLKSQRRTLVVISHDDRYYHLADRLIQLDGGQLVELSGPHAGSPTAVPSPLPVRPPSSIITK